MASFSDAEAALALAEVLAEPPFTGGLGTEELWRRLWQALWRWYDGLWTGIYNDSPVLFWLALAGLLLVAALLIWHMASSLHMIWRSIRRSGDLPALVAPTVTRQNLDAAENALQRGEHRLAVELAFCAAIQTLLPDKTPRALCTPRQLARHAERQLDTAGVAVTERLLLAHERACYSGHAVDASAARDALAAASTLLTTALRERRA
jgi:hypothetical protein